MATRPSGDSATVKPTAAHLCGCQVQEQNLQSNARILPFRDSSPGDGLVLLRPTVAALQLGSRRGKVPALTVNQCTVGSIPTAPTRRRTPPKNTRHERPQRDECHSPSHLQEIPPSRGNTNEQSNRVRLQPHHQRRRRRRPRRRNSTHHLPENAHSRSSGNDISRHLHERAHCPPAP